MVSNCAGFLNNGPHPQTAISTKLHRGFDDLVIHSAHQNHLSNALSSARPRSSSIPSVPGILRSRIKNGRTPTPGGIQNGRGIFRDDNFEAQTFRGPFDKTTHRGIVVDD